jgi:hypothetical protein
MKHFFFSLVVVGFALFLSSCQHSREPETVLFRDFNLGATVEKMNLAQLQPQTNGNGASILVGETTERRRDFNLEYLLVEENEERFDETNFLNNLKDRVAQEINASRLQTNGAGSSNDGFYFNYSKDENKGSIEVIGARVEGNKYKLWCIMRESAGIKSSD